MDRAFIPIEFYSPSPADPGTTLFDLINNAVVPDGPSGLYCRWCKGFAREGELTEFGHERDCPAVVVHDYLVRVRP